MVRRDGDCRGSLRAGESAAQLNSMLSCPKDAESEGQSRGTVGLRRGSGPGRRESGLADASRCSLTGIARH